MAGSGEILGRDLATGQTLRVAWKDGLIISATPASAPTAQTADWIAPALVDVQVNGYAGVDFQRDDITLDDLKTATRGLCRDGCTRYLLTLITDEWPRLLERLRRLRELRSQSAELQHAIAGWHVEGPFLSSEPGFHGAHDPAVMRDPTPDDFRRLREVLSDDPILVTLAPERRGAIEAIAAARVLGIRISLGHTNAPSASVKEAASAGATGFTHLGNACPQQLDRHDNIIWRALDEPRLTVGLIADSIHVSPALFRLVHRVVAKERIYYTTDAMSAAGAPPGKYTIGKVILEVGADQVVRQPGRTNFAGSALSPIEGIRRASRMLSLPWQQVWDSFSEVPRRFMGLPGGLAPGQPADFCLIKAGAEEQPALAGVYIRGEHIQG